MNYTQKKFLVHCELHKLISQQLSIETSVVRKEESRGQIVMPEEGNGLPHCKKKDASMDRGLTW